MPTRIFLQDFNLGGLSDSIYQGVSNSLFSIVGFNLFAEPGALKVSQKLTKESGATIDDFVKTIIPCSDGHTYLFGATTGKIWKRTSAGVYSLVRTHEDGKGITGAAEFNGYVYYGADDELGRWQIGTNWNTADDDWNIFTNGDTDYHPMLTKSLGLYIGDGSLVALVDSAAVYTANALDLEDKYRIKSLSDFYDELLIGTFVNDNINLTKIYRWNTWSESWTSEDSVPELGINSFIPVDNQVIVQCGTKGRIYVFTGQTLNLFKRIPGDWEGTNKAVVHSTASANYDGLVLFGLSNSAGNPAKQGIYTLGAYSSNYPKILTLSHIISQNKTADIQIGAIAIVGDDVLVSWKDGAVYGIDKLDHTNKYNGAYIETRIIALNRMEQKKAKIKIGYQTLPAGTDIIIKHKINHAGTFTLLSSQTDTLRKIKEGTIFLEEVNTLQFKIETTATANTAPIIESIEIILD